MVSASRWRSAPAAGGAASGLAPHLRAHWCADCAAEIQPLHAPLTSLTALAAGEGTFPVYAGARYEGVLGDALQAFKYRDRPDLAPALASLAHTAAAAYVGPATLVPVPLHRGRLVARGYNQAGLLAAGIASLSGARVAYDVLLRTGQTAPQVTLARQARLHNLQGAFVVAGSRLPRSVLLVDDVVTTGATLAAAAQALRAAGVVQVAAVAVAAA